jgi:hypothetical protein
MPLMRVAKTNRTGANAVVQDRRAVMVRLEIAAVAPALRVENTAVRVAMAIGDGPRSRDARISTLANGGKLLRRCRM